MLTPKTSVGRDNVTGLGKGGGWQVFFGQNCDNRSLERLWKALLLAPSSDLPQEAVISGLWGSFSLGLAPELAAEDGLPKFMFTSPFLLAGCKEKLLKLGFSS